MGRLQVKKEILGEKGCGLVYSPSKHQTIEYKTAPIFVLSFGKDYIGTQSVPSHKYMQDNKNSNNSKASMWLVVLVAIN